jgi:hypothetical protein
MAGLHLAIEFLSYGYAMTPQQVSISLRQIADKLDASKEPSRSLVAADLNSILTRLAAGPSEQGKAVAKHVLDKLKAMKKPEDAKALEREMNEQLKKDFYKGGGDLMHSKDASPEEKKAGEAMMDAWDQWTKSIAYIGNPSNDFPEDSIKELAAAFEAVLKA